MKNKLLLFCLLSLCNLTHAELTARGKTAVKIILTVLLGNTAINSLSSMPALQEASPSITAFPTWHEDCDPFVCTYQSCSASADACCNQVQNQEACKQWLTKNEYVVLRICGTSQRKKNLADRLADICPAVTAATSLAALLISNCFPD